MVLVRAILGLLAGLAIAFLLVIAVELFSAVVHPFPEGFEGTKEEVCAHVEKYPAWVLAAVVPMWALVVFCSCWIARKIGGSFTALLVGALLFVAVGFNQWMLPYPIWFEVANYIAFPLAIWGAISSNRTKVDVSPKVGEDAANPSP